MPSFSLPPLEFCAAQIAIASFADAELFLAPARVLLGHEPDPGRLSRPRGPPSPSGRHRRAIKYKGDRLGHLRLHRMLLSAVRPLQKETGRLASAGSEFAQSHEQNAIVFTAIHPLGETNQWPYPTHASLRFRRPENPSSAPQRLAHSPISTEAKSTAALSGARASTARRTGRWSRRASLSLRPTAVRKPRPCPWCSSVSSLVSSFCSRPAATDTSTSGGHERVCSRPTSTRP